MGQVQPGLIAPQTHQTANTMKPFTFTKLAQVRAEAKRRGMCIYGLRRQDCPPSYNVWADYWAGQNLQEAAGDHTPEKNCLDGLPALLAWANENWGTVA